MVSPPMEVIIRGRTPLTPQERVLAVETAAEAICKQAQQDPADATMALLTAAVHLAHQYMPKPVSAAQLGDLLATSLGAAIVAADDFFQLEWTNPTLSRPRGNGDG